jgi:hypothetical protein
LDKPRRNGKALQRDLSQKDRPLEDKLRAYKTLLEHKGNQGDSVSETLDLCLDVVEQLGCKFPKVIKYVWKGFLPVHSADTDLS